MVTHEEISACASWLLEPGAEFAVGTRKEKLVLQLMEKFKSTKPGDQMSIFCVIVDDELFEEYRKGADLMKIYGIQQLAQKGQGLQVFLGAHSREAYERLHQEFPMATCWSTVPIELYICRRTRESFRMLHAIGKHDYHRRK